MVLDRHVWANSVDPSGSDCSTKSSLITVCIFRTHYYNIYSMVNPHYSNFRIISENVWMSKILGISRYLSFVNSTFRQEDTVGVVIFTTSEVICNQGVWGSVQEGPWFWDLQVCHRQLPLYRMFQLRDQACPQLALQGKRKIKRCCFFLEHCSVVQWNLSKQF